MCHHCRLLSRKVSEIPFYSGSWSVHFPLPGSRLAALPPNPSPEKSPAGRRKTSVHFRNLGAAPSTSKYDAANTGTTRPAVSLERYHSIHPSIHPLFLATKANATTAQAPTSSRTFLPTSTSAGPRVRRTIPSPKTNTMTINQPRHCPPQRRHLHAAGAHAGTLSHHPAQLRRPDL